MIEGFKPRAQRSLRRLQAFEEVTQVDLLNNISVYAETILSEGVIGRYQNGDDFTRSIIFSNSAIYFYDKKWCRVQYSEIDELIPDLDVSKASNIEFRLYSGEKVNFEILGNEGKYRDQSTVLQFIHRVVGDLVNHSERLKLSN